MESDDRFKHLATDPRFKTLRKPQRKVQIDDRFKSMFTDKKFTLKYSKDKRGRKQNKSSGHDLRKYYSLDDKPETKESAQGDCALDNLQQKDADIDDESTSGKAANESDNDEISDSIEDENDIEDEENEDEGSEDEDSDDEQASELSSSSDESESEAEGTDDDGLDMVQIKYDWQPLDHDAETAEAITGRLAIQNLDWDRLDVRDIYTLVNSIRPPISVRIYVSEFGKERLKQEELEGPKELADMPKVDEEEEEYQQLRNKMRAFKDPGAKTYKINEYEDADEAFAPENEEIRERIRRYQLSRMKYYYAIAEFDSVESAEAVYKELDGMEYEGTSLELDLRFVPDDMKFDSDDIKAECDKIPDLTTYKVPQFINSALQQTKVKFTWDETDIKRQEKLQRAYTKEELEKDDLDAYLASETDSEEEDSDDNGDCESNDNVSVVTANSEARVNKYKMLLQSLEEEANRKKKVDINVEWGNYSEDEKEVDDGGESETSISSDEGGSDVSDSDSALERRSKQSGDALSKKQQKQIQKEIKKLNRKEKKKKAKSEKQQQHQELSEDEELDLLVMDADKKRDEFKFDPEDGRFNAVYESALYNIDPSHPNFKRTQAFDLIAEKKREKRQKTSS